MEKKEEEVVKQEEHHGKMSTYTTVAQMRQTVQRDNDKTANS